MYLYLLCTEELVKSYVYGELYLYYCHYYDYMVQSGPRTAPLYILLSLYCIHKRLRTEIPCII